MSDLKENGTTVKEETLAGFRIPWIDFAKGIAMILVIIGHTVINRVIRGAVFSFHIPLFFILSGITMKPHENQKMSLKIRNLFHEYIYPAVWMFLISNIIVMISDICSGKFNSASWLTSLVTELIWCSGVPFQIGNLTISGIGMQWFLIVLFFDKVFLLWFFNIFSIQKKHRTAFCSVCILILLLTGWVLGINHLWLPFSFDLVLFTLPYLFIGYNASHNNHQFLKVNKIKFWLSCAAWGILLILQACFGNGYFELATRHYTLFPVCFLCSIAGSFAVIFGSQMFQTDSALFKKIETIGKNSLALMFIHKVDYWYSFWFINICNNELLLVIFRLTTDLLLLYAVIHIKEYFVSEMRKTAS